MKVGNEYQTVAQKGYDMEAGLENHLVLCQFEYYPNDEVNIRGILREMTKAFGFGSVVLHNVEEPDMRILLAEPGRDDILTKMDELTNVLETEGVIDESDYYDVVEETADSEWITMSMYDRIYMLMAENEEVALSLQAKAPQCLNQYVMERLE